MRIAVTGASGFIGGAVATALADAGHDVVGFGRRPGGWSHPAARYEQWDLGDGPRAADTGVDAVIHCAALADDWAARAAAMRANVDGTRAVIHSFPDARIVHLSTSSVYDAFGPNIEVAESAAPVRRFLSTYAESKSLAEAELAGRDAVILRPHAVYGPGDTTLLPRLLGAVRRGRLVLPEGAEVRHSMTHIANLVHAVERALDAATPPGTYNVADDAPVILADLLRELFARRGESVRLAAIPYRVAFALAGTLETAARATGRRPTLTRYAVSQLGLERTLDLTAARELMRYRPAPTTLAGADRW